MLSSTPTEVVWSFDAALCMWAFLRFSGQSLFDHSGASAPDQQKYILSWKPPPRLDEWIESGKGEVSVQSLGTGGELTAYTILKGASERLEVISWGLAARYRGVLTGLLAEIEA